MGRAGLGGLRLAAVRGPQDPRRVNALIKDIERNGNEGIGKPEALKHGFQRYWSRRITDEHRLVYKLAGDEIRIAACRYHYERS
ncbi:hypothetical protein KUTG_06094 [Kutzneria sp. 744]|nr:hypothetical protein KUTG_06094 [Kutzneria sp. 744]